MSRLSANSNISIDYLSSIILDIKTQVYSEHLLRTQRDIVPNVHSQFL